MQLAGLVQERDCPGAIAEFGQHRREPEQATFAPFPAPPYSWDALAAGITLIAGIVLPFAYPPLRRGIRESPLLKAGANALLGAPGSATDQ